MRMTEENNNDKPQITVEDVQRLIKKKDEIEEQIKAYYDVLEDQGDVGMHAPLVDVEGYPRSDVDLFQIRTARHSISCLQNDHKAVMVEIEEALHMLHARERAKREQDQAEAQVESMEQESSLPSPFARVDAVTQGSPAHQAGLLTGDEIIEFGSVNTSNFQNLQNIASVVQHSEGKSLSVAVIRKGQKVHLGLTPQRWSGRGLLGCNIVPLPR
ncbi:26S proteasome non-ATPase regulatory subunit 9 [Electrophorus electricus]|uniref:26S proteasome non-ATPase regulatory subunit 9 n=1 Tax=Electrophorus electricus TaxID=8005 RepID=A0A4W4HE13_ELEEL|nr:26S proteasome non-ATPase regulatory subunit 9 [Electrophorus electricus]